MLLFYYLIFIQKNFVLQLKLLDQPETTENFKTIEIKIKRIEKN